MGLGLNTEAGGDYAPICKFDARAGRMFRVDREQDGAGTWQTNNVEITDGFQAVMDLENVEVGWGHFATGVAPSFALVKLGGAMPAKPSENHKQMFRLLMKLGKTSGGDVREFASQSKAVIGALDDLHNVYEAQKAANPGKLPLVALKGTRQIVSTGKGQTSTNYAPVFEIVRWLDRPADLVASGKPAAPTEHLPASEPVQPAQAARTPEPATADGDDF